MKTIKADSIAEWVEEIQKRGKYTFSLLEVLDKFNSKSIEAIHFSVNYLIKKRKIVSVWKGFYSIIPVRYALFDIVPPEFYIDDLMKYLNRTYYVGLFSAAAYYGAAHQKTQVFSVTTTIPPLRNSIKRNTCIAFISVRKNIPDNWLKSIRGDNGDFFISSPELTAADLITFQKNVGGLNRACTILYELMEVVRFGKLDKDFFTYVPTSTIQRLGYLLENVLEQPKQADILYSKAMTYNCKFQKIPLKNNKPKTDCETDRKWQIIINEQIEIDDL
ncbi:MAG: type IV toxin-antitoxin system AbiEi family antitoxin [Bacteroidales bacterium]|jgi:hypothetical protein|nr:type IV toxin-antitoxin system AbiEi family antitoxin [Bacteroidales bacterium]